MAACEEALKIGRLLADPFGDDDSGLKVDQAREAMTLLQSTPLGDRVGCVVVGPMDGAATLKSADVLLKSIEEFREEFVQPILWAHDLGGVPSTIRSRCLERWADQVGVAEDDDDVSSAAWSAVHASVRKDYARVVAALRILTKKEAKTDVYVRCLTECLFANIEDQAHRDLWERVRPITLRRVIIPLDVASALLGK